MTDMSSIVVTLGDFPFQDFEVPSKIPLGGKQSIIKHDLVGGLRIVDSLGAFPNDLEWSGLFFSHNALQRAQYLDYLRLQGKPLILSWSTIDLTVLIEEFVYEYERENRLPYRIRCVVVSDNNQPSSTPPNAVSLDTVIQDDSFEVIEWTDFTINTIDVPTIYGDLKSALTALNSSIIGALNAYINAYNSANTQSGTSLFSTFTQLMQLIRVVSDGVDNMISDVGGYLKGVVTLGGIFPGDTSTNSIANVNRTANNASNMAQLLKTKYQLNKIQTNLKTLMPLPSSTTTIGANQNNLFQLPATIVVQNTSLYSLASMYYQDAMKWTLIANANNLSSPYISEAITLTIPADSASSGGVLNGPSN